MFKEFEKCYEEFIKYYKWDDVDIPTVTKTMLSVVFFDVWEKCEKLTSNDGIFESTITIELNDNDIYEIRAFDLFKNWIDFWNTQDENLKLGIGFFNMHMFNPTFKVGFIQRLKDIYNIICLTNKYKYNLRDIIIPVSYSEIKKRGAKYGRIKIKDVKNFYIDGKCIKNILCKV